MYHDVGGFLNSHGGHKCHRDCFASTWVKNICVTYAGAAMSDRFEYVYCMCMLTLSLTYPNAHGIAYSHWKWSEVWGRGGRVFGFDVHV